MLIKLFTLYIYLQTSLCGCASDRRNGGFEKPPFKYKLERVSKMDQRVLESSGLAHAPDSTLWTHPDGENPAILYNINKQGELLDTIPLPQLPNLDWEDLAEDKEHLYIGDFGNNANNRQDLRIYKVSRQYYTLAGVIEFKLADQVQFPPTEDNLHFDLEAFFYHQDSLYLFTKSRGKHKKLKMYSLPATPGKYTAKLQEQLPLNAMVTAADLSPTGNQFAVLGYGKLYLFEVQNDSINLSGKHYCIPLSRTGQAEAILYTSPHELLITNEAGKLFKIKLKPRR
ncbi:hypothetical protein ABID22_001452 [Pontibacter aydingkolensis]|uniref:Uncharacterized protein n=1 Tax=Pontibacter aydingkolensis TaxID=1911536 RepID=A0ABS7CP65_9BACT|nr:hypothetical protein [Pontibacter aydingkolensis]MBW7465613.1 hypothetical protein [Pontibacter aydingkolensis]